ncbi:MAG: hypothetical protein HN656_05600 [Acidiferrobacteraceae bacterium]|nr:hypothetical protein [Acidiferrobacteraceae bacterium]MBT7517410.1 hypothetical protein [Acidiferrobacteraceae bacterium]
MTRALLPATASQLFVAVTVESSAGYRVIGGWIGCLQKSDSTGDAVQPGFNTEKKSELAIRDNSRDVQQATS